MKNQKGISLIILVLIIILLMIIVGAATFFIINNQNKDSKNPTNSNNTQNSNVEISEEQLNSWNGTYRKGEDYITLYRMHGDIVADSKDTIYLQYISSKGVTRGFTLKINSDNQLFYKHSERQSTVFEDLVDVTVSKTNDGIKLEISPTDVDDEFVSAAGLYKKEQMNELGWSGLYTNDIATICLAQCSNDRIYVSILKNVTKGSVSYSTSIANDDFFDSENSVSANKLIFKDEFFGDINSLKMTKTDKGIKVKSSSTNTTSGSSNLLNEINGLEFIKKQ